MKTILFTIYVVTVLLFSGLARANTIMSVLPVQKPNFNSAVMVQHVAIDQFRLALLVDGRMPNPCYQDPSAVLVLDKNAPNTLILRLISPSPSTNCIAKIKEFRTLVDLRQLAQASELPLDNKSMYVIKTEGFDFAMEVSGQDLMM